MNSHKFFLNIIFLFIVISAYAQSQGSPYSISVNETSIIYDKSTGQKIDYKTFKELAQKNPGFILTPNYNEYGEASSFVFDANIENNPKRFARDTTLRTQGGQAFPPFIMTSISGEKIKSGELKGKIIILNFQLFLRPPFLNEAAFQKFMQLIVDDSIIKKNVFPIILTESSDAESKEFKDKNKVDFPVVPFAHNFEVKYLVTAFPTFIIVDKNGNLVSYFENGDMKELQLILNQLISLR
ncbi:MAG: TlpA family protein disulfide reductase [Chitinophagaceae bacterium]